MVTVAQLDARIDGIALARKVALGDEAAAHRFIEAYANSLFRFVLRRTRGSVEDAEEIVQDTFIAAIKQCSTFEGASSLFTWLCCIAKFKIRDHDRSRHAQKRFGDRLRVSLDGENVALFKQVYDPKTSIHEIVEQMDRVRIVQSLLDSMTEDQREVVTMRYVEGFSVLEIAKVMQKSVKAVERLLERAKERPRQELERWFGDESFRALCLDVLLI